MDDWRVFCRYHPQPPDPNTTTTLAPTATPLAPLLTTVDVYVTADSQFQVYVNGQVCNGGGRGDLRARMRLRGERAAAGEGGKESAWCVCMGGGSGARRGWGRVGGREGGRVTGDASVRKCENLSSITVTAVLAGAAVLMVAVVVYAICCSCTYSGNVGGGRLLVILQLAVVRTGVVVVLALPSFSNVSGGGGGGQFQRADNGYASASYLTLTVALGTDVIGLSLRNSDGQAGFIGTFGGISTLAADWKCLSIPYGG
jgi:hypothetical protein